MCAGTACAAGVGLAIGEFAPPTRASVTACRDGQQFGSALQSSRRCTFEVEDGFPIAQASPGADQLVPVETDGRRAASLSVAR